MDFVYIAKTRIAHDSSHWAGNLRRKTKRARLKIWVIMF
jgi:hypothetical protein